MHKGKTGILLIILGNILYLAYTFFCGNEVTPFSEFSSGLLLGLSIGINLIGIYYWYYIFQKMKKINDYIEKKGGKKCIKQLL